VIFALIIEQNQWITVFKNIKKYNCLQKDI